MPQRHEQGMELDVEETSRIIGGDFPDEVTSKLGFDKNKMGICV